MAYHHQHHRPPVRGGSTSFQAQPQPRFLMRGDVVFVNLPQTLTNTRDAGAVTYKKRPVIVLNKSVTFKVDGKGHVVAPFNFIGMDGTSKDYLVNGRPYAAFKINPNNETTTYSLADSVRTISIPSAVTEWDLKPSCHLNQSDMAKVHEGLNTVLSPEPGFYRRRWFREDRAAGQMWSIKTHGDDRERQALILLRRGRFYIGDNGEDATPDENQETRYTPYLMAVFNTNERISNLRGIGWNDVEIRAVQEHSFQQQIGQMQKESVRDVLNNLRQLSGLKPIDFIEPPVRSVSTAAFSFARLFIPFR